MIKVFTFDKHHESRGSAYTFFDEREISQPKFVQDKVSVSNYGVVRGFHGDESTWKLVTCIHGAFRLVVYDVDAGYKQAITLRSSSDMQKSVLIPPRHLNAHQCLTDECVFLYKWSEFYKGPEAQWSVHHDDPEIFPDWPTLITEVSERDRNAGTLKELKDSLK